MSHDSDGMATRPTAGRPGFRVAAPWPRVDNSLVAQLGEIATATIADAMDKLGGMAGDIRPMWPGARLSGSAVTVWVRSGDNLMIHHAINTAHAGDVVVVNGQGSLAHGLVGELMGLAAVEVGVAGLVIDGAVRDVAGLAAMGLPVFARGVCGAGPVKDGPGEVGFPVACGGVVCCAGDVVVGDADGVVVVRATDIEVVLKAARGIAHREQDRRRAIAAGEYKRSGIEEALVAHGVLSADSR